MPHLPHSTSPPTAWRLAPDELYHDVRIAHGLLDQSFPEPSWSQAEKNEVWRKIVRRASGEGRKLWLPVITVTGWSLAAAMAALAVVTVHLPRAPVVPAHDAAPAALAFEERTTGWEPLSLGSEGNLRVKPGSRLELTAGRLESSPPAPTGSAATPVVPARRILLREGELCAQVTHRDVPRQGPLIVEAPQMRVVVIGTKFCFDTTAGVARVNVTEGRVRVETSAGMSAFVGAGEQIRSDDVRLRGVLPEMTVGPAAVSAHPAPAPAVEGCAGVTGMLDRARCYRHVADGNGLSAQNALYGLGLLARDQRHEGEAALRHWRDYQQRFPRGALAPEASLGILGELMAERKYSEAVDEADRYLKSFPDGLAVEVNLAKAEILQTGLNSPDTAMPLYLGLLTGDLAAPVRQEVLYSMGLCEQSEGYPSQARELWESYLVRFPHGPHASQVARLLRSQ